MNTVRFRQTFGLAAVLRFYNVKLTTETEKKILMLKITGLI